jgi:hypothetical protein
MLVCRTFRCSPDNERMGLTGHLSNPPKALKELLTMRLGSTQQAEPGQAAGA